eukprot:Plantae.Rhodophyta-Hildenbrandia_rubra.ctg16222.p1 GENE.Plantae.Rhodophyta-Hildenbrandia_rubra.ctg16222~~Plantae.Rhodophyta-Hildenbrandia_rubra.ctg16222.p1  ORF type:complete len:293 (+),score=30.12 Plantae.Rhodophyta-Hildenbrandia_rubra.ctg16222:535-1413(+)
MRKAEFGRCVEVHSAPTSTVYRSICLRTNKSVALKRYYARDITRLGLAGVLLRERDALTRIGNHSNIVILYGAFADQGSYWLAMEWAGPRTVQDMAKGNIDWVIGVIKALERCQELGIVHADVSSKNLVVGDDGATKLVDFGACALFKDEEHNDGGWNWSTAGRGCLDAPEVLENGRVCFATDLWGLGCVVGRIASGEAVFSGKSALERMENICRGRTTWRKPVDACIREFTESLVRERPEERLGVDAESGQVDYNLVRNSWMKAQLLASSNTSQSIRRASERATDDTWLQV